MYEEHFGLSKNPFQSIAEGEAVFEGPKQTKIISGLKTALTANDSIAVVTGPVGVGKTTIVQRALEEVSPERLVARLGRAAVGSDELVDLLLAQFGVVREPTRRFECLKTFNRILNDHAQSGARVFIVIEDAGRLGEDLLEELEALTAADGGESAGANIILMGPQKLDKLIAKPALERLRQRIRLQQTLERFNAEEVELYLRHRINAAGGDYDNIFENGTAMMVRRCSGGIPRVVNGLCETALNLAAENKMAQVTPKIVFKVAVEVFGMAPGESPGAQAPKPAPAAQAAALVARPAAQAAAPVAPAAPPVAPAAKAPAPQQAPASKKPAPAAAPAVPAAAPAVPAAAPAAPAAAPATPAAAPAAPAAAPAAPAAAPAAPAAAPAAPAAAPAAPAAAPAAKAPAPQQAPAGKKPAPAAPKATAAAEIPKPPVRAPAPAAGKLADPTIPAVKVPAAAAVKPQAPIAPRAPKPPAKPGASPAGANGAATPQVTPKTEPSRLPDLPGLGVQDQAPAAAERKPAAGKPLPDLPPKFKFADEIVVDRDTKPKLPGEPKKVDPPELPTLEFDDGVAKVADEKVKPKAAPVPPSAATGNIPTLGDSARVQKIALEKDKAAPSAPKPAAAKPATPAPNPEPPAPTPEPPAPTPEPPAVKAKPAQEAPKLSLEEPNPPAKSLEPKVADQTASFAKVDHDMLDAALASLAVHDDADEPDTVIEPKESAVEETPAAALEVTLDKNIEAERPAPTPAELDKMAAELEQTKSLDEMSDKLAETLFGSEELEAISMQIREGAAPDESPVALESTEGLDLDASATPAPEAAKASPPSAPTPPAAPGPKPATPPQTVAHIEMSAEPAAVPEPPSEKKGPQPEPIENQINTSITATLKTLNSQYVPPADDEDDEDDEDDSGGLLGRLKKTFKS